MIASTLLLLLQVLLVFGNVTVGTTLSTNDNDVWLSPSEEFAFGFRQLNGTSPSLFMVAVWYNKILDKTIVWNAKADDPAPTGSKLQLTSEGLTLTTPEGESTTTYIAKSNTTVSYGAMLDTGNFVLVNNDSTTFGWESFKNPTDTLLPNQSLGLDGMLTSRFTDTNYTRGRFQLYFGNGNVLLSPLAWPSPLRYDFYCKVDASNSASRLVFDESGVIYVEKTNGTRIHPLKNLVLDPNYYYRATLDFYGVFTQYAHPRDSKAQQGWTIIRYVPDDICSVVSINYGSGTCGYNSSCPYGYSLVDPSNQFGGCQPNFTFVCGADIQGRPEELYELTTLRNINFPYGDYEMIKPYSEQQCQQSCLLDCMCVVSILSGDTCWKKTLPLVNGRVENVPNFVYMKTRVSPLTLSNLDPSAKKPTGPDSKKESQAKPILLGSLIGSLVINGILLVMVFVILLLKPKKIVHAASLLETNLYSFTFEALKEATQGFSEELGRGSFGIVYKGTLESGSYNVVAIKKLDRLAQEREKEFKTELSAIGKTCHKNLVRLIGFCDEGIHRLLVYEFMSNGSLADILFGQPKPIWNLRVRFALGIARGLVYLHEECDTPIIHCDIKPQNILID